MVFFYSNITPCLFIITLYCKYSHVLYVLLHLLLKQHTSEQLRQHPPVTSSVLLCTRSCTTWWWCSGTHTKTDMHPYKTLWEWMNISVQVWSIWDCMITHIHYLRVWALLWLCHHGSHPNPDWWHAGPPSGSLWPLIYSISWPATSLYPRPLCGCMTLYGLYMQTGVTPSAILLPRLNSLSTL